MELDGAGGKALETLGIATRGDLIEHLPHSHRDRRDVRTVGDLMVGEEATVAVTVRSVSVRPMRDRRRKRVEARVADATGPLVAVWFNQPWIARQLPGGTNVLLHGRLRRAGEFWVSEHEPLGGGDAPRAHRGPGARASRHRGPERRPPSLARLGRPRLLPAHARAAARRDARGGAAAGARRGAGRGALPRQRGRRAGSAPAPGLRGAAPPPAGGGRAAPRAPPRASGPAARGARRGGGPLALVAPVRAHRRPEERHERDRRGPGPRAPDAASADGRGGRRQDGGGAARDAARGGERRTGRAHGPHRDAGRAAPPHARPPARRRAAAGAAHRLHARRPAGATCSARWARASSSCWWAPTR